ncbi:hypothetical protein HYH03_005986 [Edaphochlamys debaryana]|uniref:SRCR domain-containing protein n=1 Tax=Edaphochlamys debaryana TaxID=47281 RepID=A0A835Y426_9CHLO|nr:hypothetical protein HYH03_005986 [Edaphochlamys debaryana]|eukprot:KAG2496067.1 hypothetical protein HYH03_005986 [Edaphochlamys debaryana]
MCRLALALTLVAAPAVLGLLSDYQLGDIFLKSLVNHEGAIQIFDGEKFGTVCSENFEDIDAKVACRQLGYGDGIVLTNWGVLPSAGPVMLTRLDCGATHSRIYDCPSAGWGVNGTCTHSQDVGVRCYAVNQTLFNSTAGILSFGAIRLAGPDAANGVGRVEMYDGANWGSVCGKAFGTGAEDGFGMKEANVVCKELGYSSGAVRLLKRNQFEVGTGPVFMEGLQCDGTEDKLYQCRMFGDSLRWRSTAMTCGHQYDVGVACRKPTKVFSNDTAFPETGTLRIANRPSDSNPYGAPSRLEMYDASTSSWGSICTDGFTDADAQQACKEMGYLSGVVVPNYGGGSGPILLSNVGCSSPASNKRLYDCSNDGWKVHKCSHDQDVGVRCYLKAPLSKSESSPDNGTIRISGGGMEGRLEINSGAGWRSICDDGFTDREAGVACRELGYANGTVIPMFGGGGAPLITSVTCNPSAAIGQDRIAYCSNAGWGVANCSVKETVGVSCIGYITHTNPNAECQKQANLLNAGVKGSCNPGAAVDSCPVGFTCTATPNGVWWQCADGTDVNSGVTWVAVDGLCARSNPSLSWAQFTNKGREIFVRLSTAAKAVGVVPCDQIFDAASAGLIGGNASMCEVPSMEMGSNWIKITLGPGASVVFNSVLTASTTQTVLQEGTGTRSFTGSVTVARCDSCESPMALVNGPDVISGGCDGGSATPNSAGATTAWEWDVLSSVDPAGRPVTDARWSVIRIASKASKDALEAAVARANGQASATDRLKFSLTRAEFDALDAGAKFGVQAVVYSWLGTWDVDTITFTKAPSSNAPIVTMTATSFAYGAQGGVRLQAGVAVGCLGKQIAWRWSAPKGWAGFPSQSVTGQTLFLPASLLGSWPSATSPRVRVTASYVGANTGPGNSSYFDYDVDATLVASSARALALSDDSPSGDVAYNNALVFKVMTDGATWTCSRPDGKPCFRGRWADATTTNGGRNYMIPYGMLEMNVWHTVTARIPNSAVTAGTTFRPRPAAFVDQIPKAVLRRQAGGIAQDKAHNTDSPLTLVLDLGMNAKDATVAWSSREMPGLADLAQTQPLAINASRDPAAAGARVLTIPVELLPKTLPLVTVSVALTLPTTAVKGYATITVSLNQPAYCWMSADPSACLDVTVVSSAAPGATVNMRAKGWADLTNGMLSYEFGFRQSNGVDRVQQVSVEPEATIVGLPAGDVPVYVCAIDDYGARACANKTVTVSAFSGDANSAVGAVNVPAILLLNDRAAIISAANQVAVILEAVNGSVSADSDAAVQTANLINALLTTSQLDDPLQAQIAIPALAALAAAARDILTAGHRQQLSDAAMLSLRGLEISGQASNVSPSLFAAILRLISAALPSVVPPPTAVARRAMQELVLNITGPTPAILEAMARINDLGALINRVASTLVALSPAGGAFLAAGDRGLQLAVAPVPAAAANNGAFFINLRAGPSAPDAARATLNGVVPMNGTSYDVDASIYIRAKVDLGNNDLFVVLGQAPGAGPAIRTAVGNTWGGEANYTLLGGVTTLTWLGTPPVDWVVKNQFKDLAPERLDPLCMKRTTPWNPNNIVFSDNVTMAMGTVGGEPAYNMKAGSLVISIPAPGYNPDRLTDCLLYDPRADLIDSCALTFVGYDAATGRVTCAGWAAQGAILVVQFDDMEDDFEGLPTGSVAGIIVGACCAFLLIVALLVFAIMQRKRSAKTVDSGEDAGGGKAASSGGSGSRVHPAQDQYGDDQAA